MGPSEYIKGVGGMVLSSLLFAVLAALIRYAQHIDFFRMAFFRFIIGIEVIWAWIADAFEPNRRSKVSGVKSNAVRPSPPAAAKVTPAKSSGLAPGRSSPPVSFGPAVRMAPGAS